MGLERYDEEGATHKIWPGFMQQRVWRYVERYLSTTFEVNLLDGFLRNEFYGLTTDTP